MKNISSFPDYFIINESRAEVIDSKGVSFNPYKDVLKHPKEILEKYAPWYDPTFVDTPLLRRVDRDTYDEYLLIDPSVKKRKYVKGSYASTRNYVNMIVDKEWIGYPNRSNAIIGATNMARYTYGDMEYRVIPLKKNSKVAFAPSQDFWFTMNLEQAVYDLGITGHDAKFFSSKDLENLISKNIKLKRFYDTVNDFKNDLNSNNLLKRIDTDLNIVEGLRKVEREYGSIYDFLKHYINPNNPNPVDSYEFEVVKYNLNTDIKGNREFWTNAPCLLIKEDWKEMGKLNDVYSRNY